MHSSSPEEQESTNTLSLDRFLAKVEGRAFRMAEMTTGNRDEALDIVQEAMFNLVQKYAQRPANEWGALFHTILQRCIIDWHRKQAKWKRWYQWLPGQQPDTNAGDALDSLEHPASVPVSQQLHYSRGVERLAEEIKRLPLRQRQVFLLRSWEGLNVKSTADIIGCGAGSVKTHYSRALKTLRAALGDDWP